MRSFFTPSIFHFGLVLVLLLCARPVQAAAPVEITLMITPNDIARPMWQHLADEFNQSHSDVQLRILWSDLTPKINLLWVADALPDIMEVVDFRLIQDHGKLADIDDVVDADPAAKAQFYPSLLEACRYQGKLKTIPFFFNVPFVYYRPDLFRKAGLPYPTPDWTWDDFRRDAKVLTERAPDGTVQTWGAYVLYSWWAGWLSLIREAGGDLMDTDGKMKINSPATAQAIQFMHDLIYADKSAPPPGVDPPDLFLGGKIAMYYGGHTAELDAMRRKATFEWDIAPLPAGPAGKATGELATLGLGLSSHSKHPEAAREFLRFLLRKDVAREMCDGGINPPARQDIVQDTILSQAPGSRTIPPQHVEVVIDSLAYARGVPKLASFLTIYPSVEDDITHALRDPDSTPIATLPSRVGAQSQLLIDLSQKPPTVSRWWFVGQMAVVIGVLAWLVPRFFRQPVRAEEKSQQKYFFLFASPCLVGLGLFTLWPLVLSFWWSQTDYNMMDPAHYVGWRQYSDLLFRDPYFWHSLELSILYAIFAVPLGLVASLATALLLNLNLRHIAIFRVLFYLPSILPAAASGMMWVWLLNPRYGQVNRLLSLVGISGPGWLQDPNWALGSLIMISAWGFGGAMLIFLAGLKNIPESLYEAAEIDGCGTLSKFLHITLPSLSPVLFFNLTMGCIGALQVFDIAYVVSTASGGSSEGLGGPEKSTYFYVIDLYKRSFLDLNIGSGSAMAWMFLVLILAITLVNFGARRYWMADEGDR